MHAIQGNLLAKVKEYVLELTSTVFDGEEQIGYTAYGICLKEPSGEVVLSYCDISTDRPFVEHFIEQCKTYEAAAIHIPDLLEDYLE